MNHNDHTLPTTRTSRRHCLPAVTPGMYIIRFELTASELIFIAVPVCAVIYVCVVHVSFNTWNCKSWKFDMLSRDTLLILRYTILNNCDVLFSAVLK